jgi:4-alpha-glucanotransferase
MPNGELVKKDLAAFINSHSLDAWCDCHDFTLAEYLFQIMVGIAMLNDDENKLSGSRRRFEEDAL